MTRMIHIKLTIMALLWAGGFISAKAIAAEAGPFTICFLRFLIASVLIFAVVARSNMRAVWDRAMVGMVIGAAFIGVFCYNYLFLKGMLFVDAGRGSVIVSTVPVVVAAASMLFFRERLGPVNLAGVIASLCGAWVVITKGNPAGLIHAGIGKGELMMIGCVLCAAGFSFISKAMLNRLQPLHLMACISALGTALVAAPAWVELQSHPLHLGSGAFVLNLVYLAVGPSVIALMFYYDAIKSVGAARASQYMNLMPVFSVILAVLFLGEQVSGSLILGGGLVTSGLYLTNAGAS